MKKVLIVEDIPDHAFLIQHTLVNMAFLTFACNNVFRALEMIRLKEFDLVITDLKMPEMWGIDFIRYIRKFDLYIPIVVVTASADIKTKSEALEAGANFFIPKPFRKNDFDNVFNQFK